MTSAQNLRRWYRLTPDRFLMALLPIEGLLLLSERFRWFAFNDHKNWTVLIALAVVCVAVVLLFLWFGVSLVFRRRFQFSIRSLLVLVLVVAVVCSWFTAKMRQAEGQREAVEAIVKAGGDAFYDYMLDLDWPHNRISQPGTAELLVPPWLRNLLGEDFLSDVVLVGYYVHSADGELEHLKGLTSLESLGLSGPHVTDAGLVHLEGLTSLQNLDLSGTQVTDAGLVHLKALTNLQDLDLSGTQVTGEGVKKLQQTLPNCSIRY